METEANEASAQRFLDEVINRGNVALVDELLAPGWYRRWCSCASR